MGPSCLRRRPWFRGPGCASSSSRLPLREPQPAALMDRLLHAQPWAKKKQEVSNVKHGVRGPCRRGRQEPNTGRPEAKVPGQLSLLYDLPATGRSRPPVLHDIGLPASSCTHCRERRPCSPVPIKTRGGDSRLPHTHTRACTHALWSCVHAHTCPGHAYSHARASTRTHALWSRTRASTPQSRGKCQEPVSPAASRRFPWQPSQAHARFGSRRLRETRRGPHHLLRPSKEKTSGGPGADPRRVPAQPTGAAANRLDRPRSDPTAPLALLQAEASLGLSRSESAEPSLSSWPRAAGPTARLWHRGSGLGARLPSAGPSLRRRSQR